MNTLPLSRRKPGPTSPTARASDKWTPAFAGEALQDGAPARTVLFLARSRRRRSNLDGVGIVAPGLLRFARNDNLCGFMLRGSAEPVGD